MMRVLVCILLPLLIFQTSLYDVSAKYALPFHRACLARLPDSPRYRALIAGIVCGESLPSSSTSFDLQVSGLIHLIVVSGSHLILLENILRFFVRRRSRFSSWLVTSVLLLYAIITSLQPPVIRGLFSFLLARASDRAKLFFRPAQVTLLAGVLALMFAPDWLDSLSLRLSWAASLALASPYYRNGKGFTRHVIIYLVMLPLLASLTVPHPVVIVFNWLLAPLIGGLLFPVSLAATLFHPLTGVCEFMWQSFIWILQHSLSFITPLNVSIPISALVQWLYLGMLQATLLVQERKVS